MAIDLYFMRHGQAVAEASSDSLRPLTLKGRQDTFQVAPWLTTKVEHFDVVLVSSYLRARQTWECLEQKLPTPKYLQVCQEIIPSGSVTEAVSFIETIIHVHKPKTLLIVCHLPIVSYLVSEFCFDASAPIFNTSAIYQVQLQEQYLKGKIIAQTMPSNSLSL